MVQGSRFKVPGFKGSSGRVPAPWTRSRSRAVTLHSSMSLEGKHRWPNARSRGALRIERSWLYRPPPNRVPQLREPGFLISPPHARGSGASDAAAGASKLEVFSSASRGTARRFDSAGGNSANGCPQPNNMFASRQVGVFFDRRSWRENNGQEEDSRDSVPRSS